MYYSKYFIYFFLSAKIKLYINTKAVQGVSAKNKTKLEYISGQSSPLELAFGVELGSNSHSNNLRGTVICTSTSLPSISFT